MPVRNRNGGLHRGTLFDTNIPATTIDKDIFTDQEVEDTIAGDDLVLMLDVSEDPDKIKYMTRANFVDGLSGGSITVTDNESTNETNLVTFVADAGSSTGLHSIEMDGDLTYNPSSGTLAATTFSGALSGNATTATALAAGRTIAMTGDVAWTSASFDGSGNVTGAGTIQANAVEGSMLNTNVISGQSEITSGIAAEDELLYSDNGTVKRVGLDNFIELSPALSTEDSVAVASDYILFLDGGASGNMNKESISDLASAMSGTGITAGSGTFTTSAAQTGITSIYATDLIMGEDAQTAIDFGTVNEIDFKVDNAARLTLTASALYPVTDDQIDLGTSTLEFKDAFFDGTVTSDAFAGDLTGDVTGTASVATTVTITDNESTNENNAIIFTAGGDLDGGNLGLESDGDLHYNPSSGTLTATTFVGALTGNASGTAATVTGAAQSNITSLGTLTALTVDDVAINGKVVTMTGSTSDTAVFTVGTNGTLSIVTTDDAAAAANIQITADGTVDIDSAGVLTLDSGAAINIEPASGSAILLDGTISIDGGAVTGVATISASGVVTAGGFTIGSAAILEAELEILDGANLTTDELNLLDGSAKSTSSITLQDADAFIVIDGTTTKQIPASDLSAYVTAEGTMSNFVLEDDDGTEVTITNTKEIKLIGSGITTNWTDTDNGTDADPYDMTFTVDAAQTGITSIYATDLILGEDSETAIDFGTADEIDFKINNTTELTLDASALYPTGDAGLDLGTASLEFKDAFFDGTVTSDAFAGPLTGNVTGTADVATVATTVTITDNESTNENNAVIFTAGGDLDGGNLGLESDGDLHYNPSTGLLSTTGVTASGTVTFGSLSDGSVTVTAWVDEDNMASDSATLIPTQQSVKAYVDDNVSTGSMSNFILEDDDGTEVTVSNAKEVKLIGSGVTTNWTDTDNGTDGDPYDMTITVDAAQTGITSIYATDLILGEDAQTAIDFGTANEIDFKADNAARLTLDATTLYPVTDDQISLGTASLEFKDAFFDGTVTSDAFAGPLTGAVTGNADTATALAAGRTIAMTGDVAWTSASFDGSGNVTGAGTIQANAVEGSMLNNNTISGQTEITSGLAAADELLYDDGGVLKKIGLDNFVELTPALATEDAIANGDYILFLDGGASGNMNKEAVHDVATLFAGAGMTATSSVMNVIGGDGITANANDVAITPAQTTITSIYATDLILGEDSETAIDFGTANEIDFKINNTAELTLDATSLYPIADAGLDLGTSALGFNDLHLGASGIVNFDNANMKITHSTGALTVAGGTFATAALTSSTIVASGIVKTDDATDATSTTDGSLQTDGGLSVAKDAIFGNDIKLLTDSSVFNMGVDSDFTITHDGTTGATIAGNPLELDSGGAVTLDSASGIFIFQDGSTEVLRFTEGNSGDVTVKLAVNAKDLIFTDNGDATGMKILDAAAGINVPGEVQTTGIGYTDGDNSMTIADGGKVTFAAGFAVGSDAAGDMLYHNGTSYIRLAKGSADQVLTMNDGATAPGWETASSSGASTGFAIAMAMVF